jgi:hypothetical protein
MRILLRASNTDGINQKKRGTWVPRGHSFPSIDTSGQVQLPRLLPTGCDAQRRQAAHNLVLRRRQTALARTPPYDIFPETIATGKLGLYGLAMCIYAVHYEINM